MKSGSSLLQELIALILQLREPSLHDFHLRGNGL